MSVEMIQTVINALKRQHSYTIFNGDIAHGIILEALELLKEVKEKSKE